MSPSLLGKDVATNPQNCKDGKTKYLLGFKEKIPLEEINVPVMFSVKNISIFFTLNNCDFNFPILTSLLKKP